MDCVVLKYIGAKLKYTSFGHHGSPTTYLMVWTTGFKPISQQILDITSRHFWWSKWSDLLKGHYTNCDVFNSDKLQNNGTVICGCYQLILLRSPRVLINFYKTIFHLLLNVKICILSETFCQYKTLISRWGVGRLGDLELKMGILFSHICCKRVEQKVWLLKEMLSYWFES